MNHHLHYSIHLNDKTLMYFYRDLHYIISHIYREMPENQIDNNANSEWSSVSYFLEENVNLDKEFGIDHHISLNVLNN